MPDITLRLWAKLHERSLRDAEKDLVGRFQSMGRDASSALEDEITKASPRIRRALNRAADVSIDQGRANRAVKKTIDEKSASLEKAIKLEEQLARIQEGNLRTSETIGYLERERSDNLSRIEKQEIDVAKAQAKRNAATKRHGELTAKIRDEMIELRQAVLDKVPKKDRDEYEDAIIQPLRRQAQVAKDEVAKANEAVAKTQKELGSLTERQADLDSRLTSGRKALADSTKEYESIETEANKSRERASSLSATLQRQEEDLAKAKRKHADAQQALNELFKDEEKQKKGRGNQRGALGTVGNMLTELPFVPSGRAGAFIGGGMLLALAQVAEAAVTASQAITLLPAGLAAGGAAFGTLAMGVNGFGDALKNMDDPEKWAEGLAKLAPNAQQAALEIKALVDGPLGALQDKVQNTLFEGVAERFHNLANEFLPMTEALTQGISGSMNRMFDNLTGFLMTPESKSSIAQIVNNIVTAFQNLEPAIEPFTKAMLILTNAGSAFLPKIATGLADAAKTFANFLTEAEKSGKLEYWIGRGVDAAKALLDVLLGLGQKIYEVFGNKGVDEFKSSLDSIVGTATAIIEVIAGISNAVSVLIRAAEPFTKMVGGWENAIQLAGLAFMGWKTVGVFKTVAELGDLLGMGPKGVGGKLAALPAIAGTAASGIAMALGAVAIPAWLTYLVKNADVVPSQFAGAPPQTPYAWSQGGSSPGRDVYARGGLEDLARIPRSQGGMGPNPGEPGYMPPAPAGPQAPPPPPPPDGQRSAFDRINPFDPRNQVIPSPTAGLDPFKPHDVPAPPTEESKKSDSQKIEDALNSLDPNAFKVDPYAPIGGGGAGMPTMPIGPTSFAGANNVSGLGEGKTTPGIDQLAAIVAQQFPGVNLGGWRPSDGPNTPTGHQRGVALDIGIQDQATGDAINEFLRANAAALGIKSTIWRDLWKDFNGNQSTVPGHQDHVHAEVDGQPIGGNPPLLYGNGGKPYADPSYGYYDVDQEKVTRADQKVREQANDVGEARLKLAAMEKAGVSSQHELNQQRQKVLEEETDLRNAQVDLQKALQGDWKEATDLNKKTKKDALGDLGAGLDGDLGMSRGLPGLADNLVRFVGSLAMAPLMAPLAMMAKDSGGGHGLIGIAAAQAGWPGSDSDNPASPTVGAPYGPNGFGPQTNSPFATDFGKPNSPQAVANMIYQQAISRGYSPAEAQAIVAYAIGESSLNPMADGGVQGDDRVLGLFQQKSAFARSGGIDPSQRTDPVANTWAYLNNLDRTFAQNPGMTIEQALPATSVGGPLASGAGSQPQKWAPLMDQAAGLLGMSGGGSPYLGSAPGAAGPGAVGAPLSPYTPTYGAGPLPTSTPAGSGAPFGGSPGPTGPFGPPTGPAPGPAAAPAQYQAKPFGQGGWQPSGGGGLGVSGGAIGGAAQAAGSMALDAMAPGAGQAASTAMELIKRTISYGGQVASIGMSGLLETFGLSDSVLGDPSKSWIGRVLAGFSGARPATPTSAGQDQTPMKPQDQKAQTAAGKSAEQWAPSPLVHIENFTQAPGRDGQGAARDTAREFRKYAAAGKR